MTNQMLFFQHGDMMIPIKKVDSFSQNVQRKGSREAYGEMANPTIDEVAKCKKLRMVELVTDSGLEILSYNAAIKSTPLGKVIAPLEYYEFDGEEIWI